VTWTKLSDDYSDECWDLSDAAFRLLTEMLLFSNRKLLDCVIPKDDMRRFAKRPDAITELVTGGWVTDEGAAYRVVFHSKYQATRESEIKRQNVARVNGSKGGRPPKPGRERKPETQQQTRVGFGEGGPETQQLTQTETQRDGTGLASYGEAFRNEISPTNDGGTEQADPRTGEVLEPSGFRREGQQGFYTPRSA
jgi:hypothetical protein